MPEERDAVVEDDDDDDDNLCPICLTYTDDETVGNERCGQCKCTTHTDGGEAGGLLFDLC